MTAAVETMAYAKDRGVPWHGIGTPADGLMTAAEVLEKAELDWTVSAQPIYTDAPSGGLGEAQLINTHRAIVRSSDHAVLGVVGNRFVPVQNAEALSVLDSVVDSGEAKYDTAASLWDGRLVFMAMELPKHIEVAGDTSEFKSYIVGINGHDGWTPFQVIRTDIRVVCHNTLSAARSRALAKFSARHTSGVTQRVGDIRDALALEFANLESLNTILNRMAKTKITVARGKEVLGKVFPMTDAQKARGEDAVTEFSEALKNWRSTETISDKLRGTNYGLYNAIAEFADFGLSYRKEDNRVNDLMRGEGRIGDVKKTALALLKS